MNKTQKNTPTSSEVVKRITFWGTLIYAMLMVLFIAAIAYLASNQVSWTNSALAERLFLKISFAVGMIMNIACIVLTLRGRQQSGFGLAFLSIFVIGVSLISVITVNVYAVSLFFLVASVLGIGWLSLPGSRRLYTIIAAIAFALVWVIEWTQPSWRLPYHGLEIGPAATIIFTVIFLALVFLQNRAVIANRFLSFTLRTKLLVSIIGMTGLALLIYGIIFLYRSEQSQLFWSSELQNSVKQQSQQEIATSVQFEAHSADQTLSDVALAVQQLADYQSRLFSREFYFGQGGYWDGNTKLQQQTGGQYANTKSDPASVFIPKTVSLSPSFISQLNTSMYLDFSAPTILKENPIVVAVYYVGASNYTVYYPNIELSSAVPADFDARTQSFYTVASPENDPEHKPVWTAPYQDPAGTGLIVTVSVPVYDQNNQFRGVMSADMQLSKIAEQISTIKLGKTGFAFLIDPSGHIIAMPDAGYKLFGIEPEVVPVSESPKTTILGIGSADMQNITQKMAKGENGLATAAIQNTQYYVGYYSLPTIHYSIGMMAPTAELDTTYLAAREKIDQETHVTTTLSLVILLVTLLVVGAASLLLGRFLSTPLVQLTETATEVSKGNLNAQAKVQTSDEIGILASTFNSMTNQIRELIGSLEQRVAARTRNLELAAEVGRAVSQVRELNVMLKDSCELILKEFDLYYVQVYLSDPSQTTLKLEAGTGTVGAQLLERGHSLPFDANSINGRAAVDQSTVVIADTSQSATFRKNPLLPETRGEMAVPLIVANKVVGVLDMQSARAGVLNEEVRPAFEALAGQLAVAVQNANLLAEAEEARQEVEKQAQRLVRAGWHEHLDAIHKPEQFDYLFDHNEVIALPDTTESQLPEDEKAVSAPITITGEALGSLVVELNDESRRDQTNELVNLVARQVAQQIENLRLLESAERYRYEAEQAARRQTLEGWRQYMATRSTESLGYLYDTKEVHPQEINEVEETFQFTLPIKAREEMIGKLGVQDLANNDQEAVELVNAVAERLSAHIENLRLFEETRLGQVELDKRAQQLAAVAEITTVSSREFDVQKMLESVVHLTQRKFGLYHCHIFLYSEETNSLKIAACGWKEGDIHEETHGTAGIPLDQEQSLVVRAARTQKAVIVNDVHNEPGWLPNPLLPDTAAELAVPLLIGGRLLGVLDVQSDHLDAFTDEDANIQTTLASQVATALQNARSFNQAQSALTQSEKLFDASRRLTQATDLQHLVAETVALMNIPEVNRALLVTFDYDQHGDVDQLTVIGNWWSSAGHEITPIGTRYPREVIRVMSMFVSPVPVFFNDAFTDERVDATTMQLVKRLNLRAVAVLPLHLGTQQVGALILEAEDAHDFTQDEIRLFSALAPQIATVVENKRQFEKAQRQAERESMLNAIGQKIQSATSVEAVLQIAARELGRALSAPLTVAQLGMATKTGGSNGN